MRDGSSRTSSRPPRGGPPRSSTRSSSTSKSSRPTASATRARCSARAARPRSGAASSAAATTTPAATVIIPAVLVSEKPNQRGTVIAVTWPPTAHSNATAWPASSSDHRRLVNRLATTPGTISMAITRMLPTLSKAATMVTATITIRA